MFKTVGGTERCCGVLNIQLLKFFNFGVILFSRWYTGVIPKNYEEYSVDRIDSSKGYTEDNIVVTTGIVNTMKLDMSIEEFKEQIKLLYNNINNF